MTDMIKTDLFAESWEMMNGPRGDAISNVFLTQIEKKKCNKFNMLT